MKKKNGADSIEFGVLVGVWFFFHKKK